MGRYLAEKKIPIYTIGIGDPSPVKNVRVLAMFAPERIFSGNPASIDVRLDHRGFKGETVTVELLRDRETLKSSEVKLEDAAEATVRFEISLKKPGVERLTARVLKKEGEMFDNDNERTSMVEVVDQATQVLLIAGGPSSEFRMLKKLGALHR